MTKPDNIKELMQRIYRYALSLCGDRVWAEDLMQEACLRVLQKGGLWTFPFLAKVTRNYFLDQVRRHKTVRFRQIEEGDEQNHFYEQSIVDPILERALAQLKPESRELLYLFVVEGYTAKELSELTGKARGTVLSTVHRAKEKLRRILAENEPQPQANG